jgi:hypothetical protein
MEVNKQITIADLIKHLQTFPQDEPLWWYYDESGTFGQRTEMPGKFEDVKWKEKWKSWVEDYDKEAEKKVFVI